MYVCKRSSNSRWLISTSDLGCPLFHLQARGDFQIIQNRHEQIVHHTTSDEDHSNHEDMALVRSSRRPDGKVEQSVGSVLDQANGFVSVDDPITGSVSP